MMLSSNLIWLVKRLSFCDNRCDSGSILFYLQDDVVMGTLTVRENLMFSANLRLSNSLSQKDKRQRVEEILQELDLTSCADTRVSRIIILHCPHGNIAKFNVTARVWGLFKMWMFNNSEIYYQRWSCRWRWLRVTTLQFICDLNVTYTWPTSISARWVNTISPATISSARGEVFYRSRSPK